jgi:hypothetical protein
MRLWKASLLALTAAVAVVIGIVLAGVGNGVALLAYVLFIAALLFAWLLGRLENVLPPARDFQRLLSRPDRPEMPVEQYESIRRLVLLAGSSRSDLLRLRPLVRDIVAARLSRRYGIDLEREPARAGSLLGERRVWELVRPDYATAGDRDAPGWSPGELAQLVEELESL